MPTSLELQQQRGAISAKMRELVDKAEKENRDMSQDEEGEWESLRTQFDNLLKEIKKTERKETVELAEAELKQSAGRKVRPGTIATYDTVNEAEALQLWLRSHSQQPDLSQDAHYKAGLAGFHLGQRNITVPCNYDNLHYSKRIVSKINSGNGAELVYKTYSQRVTEYLTYFSPVLSVLASETTSDGNLRTYFTIDDTALESAYLTASGGTEESPTIPDNDIATASLDIGCFDITSGYQKVSFQALRDSAVSLQDKVARASAHAHARKLEREVITATGNGTTGVQGLMAADTALTPVAAFDQDALESLYSSVPTQYRADAVWLAHNDTYDALRIALRDDVNRSLFDKNISEGVEYDTLMGKKFFQSSFMPADTILFFNPSFYMLRLVADQRFQVLVEKFAPHTAWLGIMSFGGAWLGPTSAIKSLALEE